jgi:hypothetical protein
MEELRTRLEEIAELINQKEGEISLLKQDLEAIRVALEVEEERRDSEEVPSEEETVEPESQAIEEPTIQEVKTAEPKPIKVEESVEESETIMHAIDMMTHEMDAQSSSANEQFEEAATVGDKANTKHLSDLKKAIGLNERFLFANELFNGDVDALGKAIEELNHVEQADAERLMNEEFATRYKWDDENTTVITFKSLVARRFL